MRTCRRLVALVLALPPHVGCTALVLRDAAAPAACAADDDCPSGAACVDDICAAVTSDPVPPDATLVGPEGGVVVGVDGVTVTIDPGAFSATAAVTVAAGTATLEYANFTPTTRFFVIAPVQDSASPTARFRVHVPEPGAGDTLFVRPAEPSSEWLAVADDGDHTFALPRTGVFAVGLALPESE